MMQLTLSEPVPEREATTAFLRWASANRCAIGHGTARYPDAADLFVYFEEIGLEKIIPWAGLGLSFRLFGDGRILHRPHWQPLGSSDIGLKHRLGEFFSMAYRLRTGSP